MNPLRGIVSPRLLVGIAITVVIACAAVYLITTGSPHDDLPGTRHLARAFAKCRLIEPRLSGGFQSARYRPPADSEDRVEIDTDELEKAVKEIFDAEDQNPSWSSKLAWARLLLARGEGADPEHTERLRKLAADKPDIPAIRNDLGVCLFVQGKIKEALEEFSQVLERQPDMAEALYNQALCYHRLLLPKEVSKSITRFLQVERDGPCAIEARDLLNRAVTVPELKPESKVLDEFKRARDDRDDKTAARLVSQQFDVLKKHALLTLSQEYLDARSKDERERQEQAIGKMEFIGKAMSDRTTIVSDAAEYFKALKPDQVNAELALIREYVVLTQAINSTREPDKPAQRLLELYEEFRSRRNEVFQSRAAIWAHNYCHHHDRVELAWTSLQLALPIVNSRHWLSEQVEAMTNAGILNARLGRDSQALRFFATAKGLEEVKDQLAKNHQVTGMAYWHVGNLDRASDEFRQAIALTLQSQPRPGELAYSYLNAADVYRLLGNHRLALMYAEAALDYADRAASGGTPDNDQAAQVLSFMAQEHASFGRLDTADELMKEAFRRLELLDNVRPLTRQLVEIRAGNLSLERNDIGGALAHYRRAQESGSGTSDRFAEIDSLRASAYAYARKGSTDESTRILRDAIKLIEGYRSDIEESESRNSFLDVRQNVYDQLISQRVDIENDDALDLVEQSRARSLTDELSKEAPPLSKARSLLPEDLTVIEYAVTDTGTFIFVLTRSGLTVKKSPTATSERLDSLVADYVGDFSANAATKIDDIKRKAVALNKELLEPVSDVLGRDRKICIIPDKSLHFLPFGTLTVDGEYLAVRCSLSYAPSVRVLAACLIGREHFDSAARRERVLAVGVWPKNSKELGLDELPEAEEEAETIKGIYGSDRAKSLTGPRATERAIRSSLKEADVAHLALHSLVAEQSSWLAALVLDDAKSKPDLIPMFATSASRPWIANDEDGFLYLGELTQLRPLPTRLVVLSSCNSALGRYYRGEGIVSLVRPFIAAGVPTVVASLWAVNSKATAGMMREFHSERARGRMDNAEALREAQKRMMISNGGKYSHPYYWAPFAVIGSR